MIAKGITTSCRENLRQAGGNLLSRHESRHDVAIRLSWAAKTGIPTIIATTCRDWLSDPAQNTKACQMFCHFGRIDKVRSDQKENPANPAAGHLAFNAPLLTRRQRAGHLKQRQVAFFGYFAPEAREILNDLLEKYAVDGELQFTLPDVLKVPPISQHGNVVEIVGGADQLRNAVNQLQSLLYAA